MTQIIGSLMGSLASSVQPATPFWGRWGKHGINLCLLGRAGKQGMHPKDVFSTSQSLSLSLFSNPYWPLETHMRRLLHTPLPHLLSPPHATPRTTICPPPQSACGQTQNNNVILPLKGAHGKPFASLSFSSGLRYNICVIFAALMMGRKNKNQVLIHSNIYIYISVHKIVISTIWYANVHWFMFESIVINKKKIIWELQSRHHSLIHWSIATRSPCEAAAPE